MWQTRMRNLVWQMMSMKALLNIFLQTDPADDVFVGEEDSQDERESAFDEDGEEDDDDVKLPSLPSFVYVHPQCFIVGRRRWRNGSR